VAGSDDHRAGVNESFTGSPIGTPTTMVYAQVRDEDDDDDADKGKHRGRQPAAWCALTVERTIQAEARRPAG
jgi:hypothetical protein